MDKYAQMLFERCFQSYLMGGDIFTFNFPVEKPHIVEKYIKALEYLVKEDFIQVVFQSEKRVRFSITEKGIDYGNKQIWIIKGVANATPFIIYNSVLCSLCTSSIFEMETS